MKQKKQTEVAILAVANTSNGDPSSLLQLAIQSNLDVEKLERLMELQEKYLLRKAREVFFIAMSKFQYQCPVIKKTKIVDYTTKDGHRIKYSYAPLDAIEAQIKKAMCDNGLSYRWEMEDKDKAMSITCKVTHKDGHSEATTMTAMQDDSGKKNLIQQRGSTVTYLKRYTLLGTLGIGSADADVDGGGTATGEKKVDGFPLIGAEQYKATMKKVMAGETTVEKVKEYFSLTADQEQSLLIASKTVKA